MISSQNGKIIIHVIIFELKITNNLQFRESDLTVNCKFHTLHVIYLHSFRCCFYCKSFTNELLTNLLCNEIKLTKQ